MQLIVLFLIFGTTRLNGLAQWTNEIEDLAKQLCNEVLPGSEDLMEASVATEFARRYRAMLERFEQMADTASHKISMAERLNRVLQELIAEGGLSPSAMAQRRTSLARVLNSLHDLETDAANVVQTGQINHSRLTAVTVMLLLLTFPICFMLSHPNNIPYIRDYDVWSPQVKHIGSIWYEVWLILMCSEYQSTEGMLHHHY